MNKTILLLLTLFVQTVAAETEYRPLVEEGKHWMYDNFLSERPAMYDYYYYYDLKGDTLIAGKRCLKMYIENEFGSKAVEYRGSLYEENKKVYFFPPNKDTAELIYDFDCAVGDTIHLYNENIIVKDIKTEDNGNIPIKKYSLQYKPTNREYGETYNFTWIEGVGATKDFFAMIPLPGNYNTLQSCECKGEKLYQIIKPELTEKGYHKMGIEGKRWNYIHYYIDDSGEHCKPYSYVVKGDTVIKRIKYPKLIYQDHEREYDVCLLYEEGRSVYKCDFGNNSFHQPIASLYFDFGREDFGRVYSWESKQKPANTNWMVYDVDTIQVDNHSFRRIICLQKYSEKGQRLSTIEDGEDVWHDIWIEGIGSVSSGIEEQRPASEPQNMNANDCTYFVSCYEGDECIFMSDNPNIPNIPDNIRTIRPSVSDKLQIFDLQGRRLHRIPEKGMYIKDGKKYVMK
ncbi:MAG: hypothetical protein K6D91_03430 [Prevotella sp.]|nr:hypothetical protein [Prevotella sp.]